MSLRIKLECLRNFEGHDERVDAVAVLPDGRHMVSGSADRTLHLWDLKTGVVLKKMEGHYDRVKVLAVSRDGQLIASGDESGHFIVWQGETRESLTESIKAHSYAISSLDFSPDGTALATANAKSTDGIKLWCAETWKVQGDPIHCRDVRLHEVMKYMCTSTNSSTVFGIRRLANILPSRQIPISQFIIHAQGTASQISQVTEEITYRSRGCPMAHAFSQGAVITIPAYGSGMHQPGSRLMIPGKAILT